MSDRFAAPAELPGTVNLVPNPLAARDLLGWSAEGGATIERDLGRAWEAGGRSVRVACPGVAPDEGVSVATVRGLRAFGVERVDFGQIRLAGEGVPGVVAWVRGVYADGGAVDGERTPPLTLTRDGYDAGGWHRVAPPAFFTDPLRTLDHAAVVAAIAEPAGGPEGVATLAGEAVATLAGEAVVVPPAAGAATFWATAAQVEADRGAGATRFAYGGYGPPWHRWAGAEHASVSVREPTPLDGGMRGDGTLRIEARLYRATHDNAWVEDVSDGVLSGTVTMDPGRDVTWTLSAEITRALWAKLEPYEDWVAPHLTVTTPDGTVREGQLGLYLVRDSAESRDEWGGGSVQLDAMDVLWAVSAQGFTGPVAIRAGTNKLRGVRELLDQVAFLRDRDGRRRFSVPGSPHDWTRGKEWPQDQDRLDLCNRIARSANFTPLFVDRVGEPLTIHRGADRLRRQAPVRSWAALAPDGTDLRARFNRGDRSLASEVVGVVAMAPRNDSVDDVVVVNDDPGRDRIRILHRVTHPNNPRTRWRKRGHLVTRTVRDRLIDDDATARELAAALAEELASRNRPTTLSVLPDPSVEYGRATVSLAIWDLAGEPVAVGTYAVQSVTWGFDRESAMQTMALGRVVEVGDVEAAS